MLQDGIVSVIKNAHEVDVSDAEPAFMLMIGVSCANCGNMHFLDIVMLELESILPADVWTKSTVESD